MRRFRLRHDHHHQPLSRNLVRDGSGIQDLVDAYPEDVISVLKHHAVNKLGTFQATVSPKLTLWQLVGGTRMIGFGSAEGLWTELHADARVSDIARRKLERELDGTHQNQSQHNHTICLWYNAVTLSLFLD